MTRNEEIQQLLRDLRCDDIDKQRVAAYTLGEIGDETTIPEIMAASYFYDAEEHGGIIDMDAESPITTITKRVGEAAIDHLVLVLRNNNSTAFQCSQVVDALVALDDVAIDVATLLLNEESYHTRIYALKIFGKVGNPVIIPTLANLFKKYPIQQIADALAQIETSLDTILEFLKSADKKARLYVVRALEKYPPPANSMSISQLNAILEKLTDESWLVKSHTISLLGAIGHEAALSMIFPFLNEQAFRADASNAILKIQARNGIPKVLETFKVWQEHLGQGTKTND